MEAGDKRVERQLKDFVTPSCREMCALGLSALTGSGCLRTGCHGHEAEGLRPQSAPTGERDNTIACDSFIEGDFCSYSKL